MTDAFSIEVRQGTDECVIAVAGELDLYDAEKLREVLSPLVEEPGATIVVDMSELSFVDSTGIGVLVAMLKRARAGDGDLVLRRPSERITAVLSLTGLDRIFVIQQT
jgi:anti-sigma B factor antagonist